jgi:hypothetical protein
MSLYTPLSNPTSTRLLKVFPSEPDSDTVASLEEVDLDTHPVFECLSYTWGTSTNTSRVTIDNKPVAIRKNLYGFLRKLSSSTQTTRTVWVDAMCISQTDLDEKAHQVAMIGRIFSQAARVLVWLGDGFVENGGGGSSLLFQPRARNDGQPFWRRTLGAQPSVAVIRQRVTLWNAFLERPYWKRTWIVQEVICARTIVVHCGAHDAEWEALITPRINRTSGLCFDGISLVSSKLEQSVGGEAADRFRRNVQAMERLANSRWSYWQGRREDTTALKPGHQIVYLCPSFAGSESFDRRDKIYAMLSLEREQSFRDAVGVDYKIGVEQLFGRVLGALEQEGWNGRLAASSLVRIFNLSQQGAIELLGYLTAALGRTSNADSLNFLRDYICDGDSAPFSDTPSRNLLTAQP